MADRTELIRTIEKLVYGTSSDEWINKPLYDTLPEDEKALADGLLDVHEKVGPFDLTESIWVGYASAEENEDAAIGVKCDNCALMASSDRCMILDQTIEAEGNCRFSVIPPGYVG
jgi:hypothetical protein